VRYPGLKEELYLGEFTPDPRILERLGLARPSVLVVVRTPPSRAIYHAATHRLFDRSLAALGGRTDLVSVVLARHPEQAEAIRALGLGNCVVPQSVVDSRALLYAADAMVGAGGTMTREAALLGIPTWSLFAGRIPAVERWLEGEGRLRRVVEPGQLARLAPRRSEPVAPVTLRRRGDALTRLFVDATIAAGERRGRGRATGKRRGTAPPRAPRSNGA
jgi:predicted glycosyltransferase